MRKTIYAALLGAAVISAPLAAFAQEGPRPSSLSNWPGISQNTPPAYVPSASPSEGPRPSSLSNWPGVSGGYAAGGSYTDPSFAGPRPSPNH